MCKEYLNMTTCSTRGTPLKEVTVWQTYNMDRLSTSSNTGVGYKLQNSLRFWSTLLCTTDGHSMYLSKTKLSCKICREWESNINVKSRRAKTAVSRLLRSICIAGLTRDISTIDIHTKRSNKKRCRPRTSTRWRRCWWYEVGRGPASSGQTFHGRPSRQVQLSTATIQATAIDHSTS